MYKSIFVPLTGLDGDGAVLDAAHQFARLFNAHLDCTHIRPGIAEMVLSASPINSTVAPPRTSDVWKGLNEDRDNRANAAKLAYEEFCCARNVERIELPPPLAQVSAAYRELDGNPVQLVSALSRVHDLIVLNRSSVAFAMIGDVLVGGGRPLLMPPRTPQASIATTVAVAWKETPQAARALGAAIPILAGARDVAILVVPEQEKDRDATIQSAMRVSEYLQWHRINAEAIPLTPDWQTPHGAIMEAISNIRADLLVMGGYGHGRLQERVFGGFTQAVLNDAPLAVFMVH